MIEPHISGSVVRSRVGSDEEPASTNSHHADQVIEVARNELELLRKQQRVINKKVKQVKRAVEGLTTLFGESLAAAKVHRAERSTSNHALRSKSLKPKLERACRIALLESEESATATQIYDRITRRKSYPINRYKHPLAQVISTLNILAQRGEIEARFEGDAKQWKWNREVEEVKNEFTADGFHSPKMCKRPIIPPNAPINAQSLIQSAVQKSSEIELWQ